MNFKEVLESDREIINNKFNSLLKKEDCLEKRLNESIEYSLMAGGKRIRPILVMEVFKLFNDNIDKCIPYALAIEMVHNFSLIHDDLPGIDNDDLRHGKPTNHKKFNEATAILAGDGLLNWAYIIISDDLKKTREDELSNKIKVFNEFSNAIERMIAGEFVDTEFEKKEISKEELEYIHENKTGALLVLCARMGAILGDSNENELEHITNYAKKIGLAFQIKDDILSEEGSVEELGKPVGNDKKLGKGTYVLLYGLQKSKEILDGITKDAIEELNCFGEKAAFLKSLALYIQTRNK